MDCVFLHVILEALYMYKMRSGNRTSMKVCMDKKLKRTPTLIIVRVLPDRALVPVAKVFQLSIAVESVYTQHTSLEFFCSYN